MDEICDKISDADFKNVSHGIKENTSVLGNEIHTQLRKCDDPVKEPNALAKECLAENRAKLAVEEKLLCADLLTENCNIGVKSLCRWPIISDMRPRTENQGREFCKN